MSGITLREWLYDPAHPLGSPALGRFVSLTLCALGHNVVVMDSETWDEPWLACSVCGARFLPESMLSDEKQGGDGDA
jgi:hypothetical protein